MNFLFLMMLHNSIMLFNLNVPSDSLDAIERDHERSPTSALEAVFTECKKFRRSPFTWKVILDVLASDSLGEENLADTIREKLSSAK